MYATAPRGYFIILFPVASRHIAINYVRGRVSDYFNHFSINKYPWRHPYFSLPISKFEQLRSRNELSKVYDKSIFCRGQRVEKSIKWYCKVIKCMLLLSEHCVSSHDSLCLYLILYLFFYKSWESYLADSINRLIIGNCLCSYTVA